MKRIAVLAVALMALSLPALCQAPPSQGSGFTFSTGSMAIASLVGKDWNAGTDLFGDMTLTQHVFIRSDNYVFPDGQSFFNGIEGKFSLGDVMSKTAMASDAQRFLFSLGAEPGVTRTPTTQRTTWNAFGRIDFDIKKDGSFALNLIQFGVSGGLPTPTGIHSGKSVGTGLTLTFK